MYFCWGSLEKAMSQTDPSPRVFVAMKASLTKVPSFLKTRMRSFGRSDIEEAVVRKLGAVHWITKLLRRRPIGIVGAEVGVIGLLTIGAPVALVLSGFRVIDDHAVIPVTIGYI